uniref:Uncharacterized protein n=1 Tax=Acrobeloides nanus TaxID=290746 RepID=A0A914DTC4_9BILA
MVIKKATLLYALKMIFEKIYGQCEVQEMENALEYILEKSDEKESIYEKLFDENAEDEARTHLQSLLDKICKSKHNIGHSHSPQSLFELAKLFRFFGDCRISSELIWDAASLAILNFASELEIVINSHNGKRRFAYAVSNDLGLRMCHFELCHSAFYTNCYDKDDIDTAFKYLEDFLSMLQNVELNEAQKTNLYNERYKYV